MAGIKLDHGPWVVVADGEKALFLRNEGDNQYPNLSVFREMQEENPPTREQGSDRPGRFSDGPSPHRSAVADTDWHRFAKERFADEVAECLYRLAHAAPSNGSSWSPRRWCWARSARSCTKR